MAGTKMIISKYGSINNNNSFGKFLINGQLIEAQNVNDTIELKEGQNIKLSFDQTQKIITIDVVVDEIDGGQL